MITVDTNLIAYLLMPGEQTEGAEQVYLKDPTWIAPYLWRSEFANVLTGYLRRGDLSVDDALILMEQGLKLLSGNEYLVDMDQVLTLTANSTCSAYDCEFVGLARALGVPLVTADRKIIEQFSGIAQSPEKFIG